ncbi:eCIS core domain-containing protein [Kineosphaera limosa]|nr:DUF4157 domain-containing protein [Kineosphaera limosa]
MELDRDAKPDRRAPERRHPAPALARGGATPAWAADHATARSRAAADEKSAEDAEAGRALPGSRAAGAPRDRSPLASDEGSPVPTDVARAAGADPTVARVHEGPEDQLFTSMLGARAATHGRDIFLARGESAHDVPLMTHELTHVAQGGDQVRLRKATHYERRMWLGFYDHYLPRKLLKNYMDDTGKAITLTAQEMIDCNPIVDLRRSKRFMTEVAGLAAAGGGTNAVKVTGWGGARTNGTLGNFTITYDGIVTVKADGSWVYLGTMTFYDYWDFDPKGAGSGRSTPAELQVRVAAALLPGKPFKIFSVVAALTQTSDDTRAQWGDMKAPAFVDDKKYRGAADIATGDVAGGPAGADVIGTQASEDLNK